MSDWETVAASESAGQDFLQFLIEILKVKWPNWMACCTWNNCLFVFVFFFFISSRMLLEKSTAEEMLFSVTVSDQALTLQYGPNPLAISFRTEGRLPLESWTHLVLQVTNIEPSILILNHIGKNNCTWGWMKTVYFNWCTVRRRPALSSLAASFLPPNVSMNSRLCWQDCEASLFL